MSVNLSGKPKRCCSYRTHRNNSVLSPQALTQPYLPAEPNVTLNDQHFHLGHSIRYVKGHQKLGFTLGQGPGQCMLQHMGTEICIMHQNLHFKENFSQDFPQALFPHYLALLLALDALHR